MIDLKHNHGSPIHTISFEVLHTHLFHDPQLYSFSVNSDTFEEHEISQKLYQVPRPKPPPLWGLQNSQQTKERET